MMLTVKQVAETFQVSERSVWRWSVTGVLPPGVKIGATVRWPEESIRQWVQRREQDALAKQKALAAKKIN
jgi:predicted DNA-binding transcriptional regulator AlpA